MPRSAPPRIASGGRRSPSRAQSCAPICRSGSITRPIGRERREASPVSTERNGWPARMPLKRRRLVPLLPASRISAGSRRPRRPIPRNERRMRTSGSGSSVLSTLRERRIASVERQLAPGRKFSATVSPSASAPSIATRCEIDLSPGGTIVPRSRATGRTMRASLAVAAIVRRCGGATAALLHPLHHLLVFLDALGHPAAEEQRAHLVACRGHLDPLAHGAVGAGEIGLTLELRGAERCEELLMVIHDQVAVAAQLGDHAVEPVHHALGVGHADIVVHVGIAGGEAG